MSRGLRFPKWATRTERHVERPRANALGRSVHHARLVFETLEARTLLSVAVQLPAGWEARPPLSANLLNSAGSSTPYGLTPSQIRGAYYGPGVHGDGSGQTIAIVDAYDDPNALSDLNAFSTYFGLPTFVGNGGPTFQKLNQTGGTALPGTDPNSTWEMEESLDIEWAHVMAPMANIILFEASDNMNNGLFTAVQTAANTSGVVAISMSWGGSEFAGETAYDATYFVTPPGHVGGAASLGGAGLTGGITFLASAGDSGAYDSQDTSTIMPQYPACSPNVVAVGGTSLTVNADNSYENETSWGNGTNSGTDGGGGGGISVYESQPTYQTGVVNGYSTTARTYPDVSAEADPNTGVPIYDSWDFGTSTPWCPSPIGGTSLACPLWAGVIAVADQGRATVGSGSLNGADQTLPDLYQAYKTSPADFHDIISGNSIAGPIYAPGAGYDLATGLGSPVGASLIPRLVGVAAPTVTGISLTSGSTAGGTSVTITGTGFTSVTAVDLGSTPATSFVVNTATQIIASVPPSVGGIVDVTVTAAGGTSATSSADRFTYVDVPVPMVTAISLTSGSTAGGTSVRIAGATFTGVTAVDFGGIAAAFTVNSNTQITATSPTGTGTVDVTVTTASGTSATLAADRFTYVAAAAPTVTAISPTSGSTAGGTAVTITGTDFTGATAVDFGDVPATSFVLDTATQITATSPAGTAQTVNITVTTAGGISAISAADRFTYVAASGSGIGLYNPTTSVFSLRNTTSLQGPSDTGNADETFAYSPAGAGIPIAGDWNGDGQDTVGLYYPATSTFYLSDGNATGSASVNFMYGPANSGDIPVVGDWNGDGKDTIGLYNPATSMFYLRNSNSSGYSDVTFVYGPALSGLLPIAGDWNGDGTDTIGLYNSTASVFYLRNSNSSGYADINFAYGPANTGPAGSKDIPIAGDWNGDGADTVGLYNPTTCVFYLKNSNSTGYADVTFAYGLASGGLTPLAGYWTTSSQALLAANQVAASASTPAVTQGDLQPIVGGTSAGSAVLDAPVVEIGTLQQGAGALPGSCLVQAGDLIHFDTTAAGHDGSTDSTLASGEVSPSSGGTLQLPVVEPRALDQIDLSTVVNHELGNVAGLQDLDALANNVTSGVLGTGIRRNAAAIDTL